MFGRSFFGAHYYGPRYFGGAGAASLPAELGEVERLAVEPEDRVLRVAAETRTFRVPAEPRTTIL